MENITMITTAYPAALVPSADDFGGAFGVFLGRDRTWVIDPKSAFFADPRPAGPPV